MAWDENKKIKFVIDHNKVDDTLHNFPVTMKISDSCGINLVNLTTTSGTTASGTIFEEATSALSPNYDFTGTDGDAPDWRQWYLAGINSMTYCSIQNNKLNYSSTTASDCYIYSNYEFVGDFDVQFDFDLVTHPETNNWSLHFYLSGSNHGGYLIREYAGSTNRYRTGFYTPAGGSGGGATTSLDHLTGKLRWVRTGGTVYAYYWTGSWVLMSTSPWSDCTEPMRLLLRLWQDSGPSLVEYNIDNVQVNSGSVRWDHLKSKVAVFAGGNQNTGTRCFIDLEKFNTLDEEIVFHVGVPEISNTEDTELHLYYDEDNNTNANGYPFSWWASLTPEDASDSFTVSGTPNSALWSPTNDVAYVQSGKLVMDLSSVDPYDDLRTTYTIYGDFDIQVDFDVSSAPTTDGWYVGLHANTANSDLTYKGVFSRRRYDISNGHNYNSGYNDGGPWTSVYTPTTSGSGKLRITREDHVVKSYYYEDGSWQLNQTGTLTSLDNVPMGVHLQGSSNVGEPTYSAYFDNFIINKAFIITDNYLASDTFVGPDYSEPNRERWRPYPGATAKFIVKDNSLYVDADSTGATTYNTHWLDGDFDVQVDFNLVTWPSTDVGYAYMRFQGRDSSDDFMTGYCGRRYDSGKPNTNMYFASFYNSGWTGETSVATSDTTGKFRFYRDGNIIYSQYWNGANWTTLDSEDFGAAPEVYIYFQAGHSTAAAEIKFDNFKVNSTRRMRGYISGANAGAASNVWDPRYRFVCHFGEIYDDPTAGYDNRTYDASYWHRRGTAQSNMTYSDKVDSKVGGGFDFDGTDDYINFGTFNPSSTDLTIEFLWNLDQLASVLGHSHHTIVKRDTYNAADMMWQMHISNSNDKLAFTTYTDWTGSQIGEFDTLIQRPGEWQNLAIVHDSGATDYMYVDGHVVESHAALTFDSDTAAAVVVGAGVGGTGATDGKIDEVRISNKVREPEWLKSTYYSLFDDLLYIDWLPGPQGFDSTKYIQFFVDHSNIDNTLSNFPVRFRISNQSGIDNIDITRVFDELSYAARKKIAVTTADQTTQCYVEIEDWDDSRQEANLWIKVPSLSPQQQTEFYLYYDSTADDNTDWVGDTGDVPAQNVWDSNFQIVSHQEQDPTGGAGAILDSTNNSNNGTAYNMESGDLIDGRPGKALDYDGSAEYCDFGDAFYSDRFTVEVYVNPNVVGDADVLALKRNNVGTVTKQDPPEWQLNMNSTGTAQFTGWNSAVAAYDVFTDTSLLSAGSYYYVAGASAGNGSQVRVTINDIEYGSSNATNTLNNQTSAIQIAARSNNNDTRYGNIKVSEFRVSNVYRSTEWRKATYYTLNDDMIYYRMPWDETHSEILMTISGSLINDDLTNFPLTLTLASGVGTNAEDVTKIFDGLTLSGTLGYSDDFTGWNGDVPDPLLWNTIGDPTIQSNKLRIHDTGNVETKYVISGDCEFTVDWEDVVAPSTDSYWWELRITYDSDNYHGMAKGYWSGATRYDSAGKKGGGAFSGATTTSHTGGKFRFVRGGTTWDCYYWTGAAWSQSGLGNAQQTSMPSGDLTVKLLTSRWGGSPSIDVDFDNFTVVSGTVHADQTRKKIAIFSDGDQHTGDKCFTEIEHWDSVNETAALHVQVPTLTSGTDTDLYLYEDINQPDQDYRLTSEANDAFTGTTGDSPDQTKWTGTALINNNKLRFDRTAGTRTAYSRFLLEDDFDIEIDVDFVDDPETPSWFYYFTVRNPVNDYYVHFEYGYFNQLPGPANQLGTRFRWWAGGGTNDTDAQDGAQITGKWRFARVDDTVSGYYDYDGGGWVKLDDDTGGSVGTNPVELVMGISWWTGTPDAIVDIDNFTINAGTVTGFVDDTGGRPAQEVWDGNFKGVWHMAQEPSGADDTLDSTSNYVDGTSQNMEAADLKDGQVGKALEFDGTAEWVDVGDVAATDPGTGELTVEILAKRNASGIDDFFISKGNVNSTLEGWSIWQSNSVNDLYVRCNASDDTGERASQTLTSGILDTNWHTVALVLDHTDEKIYGYKDGSNSSWIAGGGGPADDDITGFDIDTTDELAIAAARDAASTSRYANATIDEVRVSSTARTPGWIETTHDSLFDDLVFYDLLEPAPPTPPEPPTPSGLDDAMGWTSINDVLTSGIVVRLYRRTDGSLVGEDISATLSGTWNIPTTYDEYHYAVGLYPVSGTNSLIYDWLHPTLNP